MGSNWLSEGAFNKHSLPPHSVPVSLAAPSACFHVNKKELEKKLKLSIH